MVSPPLEVLQQIDQICDEFESQGCGIARIRQLLERVPIGFRGQLFVQLAAIDMEASRRVQQSFRTSESYVALIGDSGVDWHNDEIDRQLVIHEFKVGLHFSDEAPVASYVRRFPDLEQLESRLRHVLWQEYPVVIQVGARAEHVFPINRRVIVGRQRSADPPPIKSRELDDGSVRIIVAARDQATVGRKHVILELETNKKVRITRKTEKSSVELSGKLLPFDTPEYIEAPMRLLLGPLQVFLRVESGVT